MASCMRQRQVLLSEGQAGRLQHEQCGSTRNAAAAVMAGITQTQTHRCRARHGEDLRRLHLPSWPPARRQAWLRSLLSCAPRSWSCPLHRGLGWTRLREHQSQNAVAFLWKLASVTKLL